jgi:small subunit ribosomal protein S17
MADEEKNETTDETTETTAAEEVSAPVEEASDSPETVDEAAPAEEVSDTPAPEASAEEVSETPAPAAREKPKKSLKHVPRSLRRTRTRPKREAPKTRKPITRTEKPATELGRRQERRGVVVSDKGDKTIVVKVDVIKSHPKYKKVVRSTVKFHAHDEQNTAGVGDTVRIVETRPLSKTKRWRLAEIVEKAR